MIARQKQMLETCVRVQAFVQEHPVTGPLSYGGAPATLDDVVPRLREHAGAQITGQALSRAELRFQAKMVQQLRDQHMRPIAAIARAQIERDSDVRMPAAIRMPSGSLGVTKILQACDGMIAAARPFEAAFVANGLPADFLARFTAARNELEGVLGGRATLIGTHVGARAGLQVEMRRGRSAIDRIDAVVRAAFAGDDVILARWRAAKRVHQLSGGAARSTDEVKEAA